MAVLTVALVMCQSIETLQDPALDDVVDVDYVLVGAGMSGIFMLAEGLQQGFKSVLVFDKKDR